MLPYLRFPDPSPLLLRSVLTDETGSRTEVAEIRTQQYGFSLVIGENGQLASDNEVASCLLLQQSRQTP